MKNEEETKNSIVLIVLKEKDKQTNLSWPEVSQISKIFSPDGESHFREKNEALLNEKSEIHTNK